MIARIVLPLIVLAGLLAGCNAHPLPDTCYQKPESGRCKASITRWYYEDKWGECRAFIWGGCAGVAPFETQAQCESTCRVAPKPAGDGAPPPAAATGGSAKGTPP